MAIIFTRDNRHRGGLKISVAYNPLLDDLCLSDAVLAPSIEVSETTPGEIAAQLAKEKEEREQRLSKYPGPEGAIARGPVIIERVDYKGPDGETAKSVPWGLEIMDFFDIHKNDTKK